MMKLKITCFIVLFLMVSVNLLNTDNLSFAQSLQDEETSKEVILSLNSTNIPGFQEGSIFTDTTLSSGAFHTCAILDNGSVSCWGNNQYGQLGDGTTVNRTTPTQTSSLGTGRTAVAISSGIGHTCAILDDGSVSCWGWNYFGQLGDGTTVNRTTPTQTSSLGTGRTAVAISSGSLHTCAILDDGSVSCWGNNNGGHLGDGTTTGRNTPTQTSSLGTNRTAVAISSGGYHTCAILDNGTVSCWGWNAVGQLGDGTGGDSTNDYNRNTPTQTSSLGTGRTAVAISSGTLKTCAILDDGSVSCWGSNSIGQLGDGTTTDSNTPTQTASLGTGRTAVAISSGFGSTCAILDDASVSCWGYNLYGQLGDGTTNNRSTPAQTSSLGTGRTAVAISSGYYHACALLDDATVSCWGNNSYGQLGDGTYTDRNTPIQTSSLGTTTNPRTVALSERDFDGDGILNIFDVHHNLVHSEITISSGNVHSCAILDDATVSCWGYNGDGQLGDGTTAGRNTPTQTSSIGTNRTAVAISSGSLHTCAILDDGTISCWGSNYEGLLGDGTNIQRNTPTQTSSLGTGRTAVAISSGSSHTCALLDDASVSCWGDNYYGQLGDGTGGDYTNDYNRNTPTQTSSLGTGRTAVAISSGGFHTCAILDDGSVSCWGRNNYGELGDGTTSDKNTSTQTSSFGAGRTAVAISSGAKHTCAILDNGSVSCWGYNGDGQLGDGTTTERNTPTQTSSLGTGRTAVAISSGVQHTCAILDDATVSCWGRNAYGQLGDTTTTDRNTPTQTSSIGTGRTAVVISSGAQHTCVILDGASVSCWGWNGYGQLGDGTTIDRSTPTQTLSLGTGRPAVAVSSGWRHTCAIVDDASVSCWGDNSDGRLGDGTTTQRNTPTQTSSLGTGRTAVAISTGGQHTCAILDDGSVSCWGDNGYGQLGDGSPFSSRNTPTQTSSLGVGRTAVAISSGAHHSCAILDDGTVSCWGYNNDGQLGDGTNHNDDNNEHNNRNTPTQTSSLGIGRTAVAISSGEYHTCAILDDSSVSCWGSNGNGRLGDGTYTNRNTPTHTSSLGTGRSAVSISSGNSHTCAILDDASASCWGDNWYGQLGDGTNTERNRPTQTSSLGTGRTAVVISPGYGHTCAVLDDASVSCWGYNYYGQLADGTTTDKNKPTQTVSLGSGRTAVSISSGLHYSCAILDNESVSCWGANGDGRLGDGTNANRGTPAQTSSFGTNRTALLVDSDMDGDGTLDDLDDFPNNSIRSIACTSGQYGRYLCVDSPAGKYVPSSSAMYATDCAAGTYQALTGQTSCVDADVGYYVATISQTSQIPCAIGTYQALTGQASCHDADTGYYVATTAQASQIPCAIGTYQALTGQASCDDADAGYYVSFTAQSAQTACAIGTYQALTGQASCVNADAGHYVGQTGQFNQIECLAGTYQPNIGQYSCINASIGFYVLLDGAIEQTACPYLTSTKEVGSKLASDCVSDTDDDGTIDVDDAFPLDPSEDKDSDGDGRGDNIQEIDEAKQMRMILIAAAILFVTASVIAALVMISRKKDAEGDWHQEDSPFD